MLKSIDFKNWLVLAEFTDHFGKLFLELNLNYDAINRELSNKLGFEKKWYELILSQCNKFAPRGSFDAESLANDVTNDIIMSLTKNDPNDKLASNVERIKASQPPDMRDQLSKLITSAAYLRARQFEYKYRNKSTHFSTLTAADGVADIPDNSTSIGHQNDVDSYGSDIAKELTNMMNNSDNMASKKRLQKAIEILPMRLRGDSTEEIRSKFPQDDGTPMAKSSFANIIKDIAIAYKNVLEKLGHDGMAQSIMDKMK